jgi:outer membrane receptor protein involved in Fe transport
MIHTNSDARSGLTRASLTAAILAFTGNSALAEAPAPSGAGVAENSQEPIQEVVISASRLTTGGFNAPTPTEVLDTHELQQNAEPNIAASVGQLPALSANLSSSTNNGGASSQINGLTELNLRALGTDRTLILLDGQRLAPSFYDGTFDISLLPQLLIQRVDVVTGGVSASYGSDAVAGVVNFVTNTHFTGIQGNVEGGISNYGDDKNGLVQLAWGAAALDNRFHVVLSGEYYNNNGVPARPPGANGGPDGRTWYNTPLVITRTPTTTPAGQPQDFLYTNAQFNSYGAYGLITSGPLKNIAFGPNGTPYTFQVGSSCIGSNCIGGDQTGDIQLTNNLDAALQRGTLYTRLAYDLTSQLELYSTVSYASVHTGSQSVAGTNTAESNLTLQCSNPYFPASIQAACAANGLTQLPFGVSNINFPGYVDVLTNRTEPRYVLGLNGEGLMLFNQPWNLQSYVEYGETQQHVYLTNIPLIPRYLAAINATTVNGQIVCSSATAAAAGCIPYDVIGQDPVNPAAWSYLAPSSGPSVHSKLKEEAGSIALSGAPLQGWAGPVSVAVGAEWRQESYAAVADWYGNGVNGLSPINASYPADPVLSTAGNNWYVGNFHDGTGLFNVREGFAEIGLPLWDNHSLGKFDADAAGRETHYSTAGSVFTWKLGGVWDTPLDGMRLRAVRSQDIRAPNLQDLYAPELVQNMSGLVNRLTGQSATALVETVGNPALKPEIAQNLEFGIVLQPTWIRGFQASFDYYKIKVTGAVETLTAQQEIDLCQIAGNQSVCGDVSFSPAGNTMLLQPFNAATISLDGFDIAATYQFDLGRVGLPGTLLLSGQASHSLKFSEDTGIPGQPILNFSGANDSVANGTGAGAYSSASFGMAPNWKGLVKEEWSTQQLAITLIERFLSAGKLNPNFIQCDPGSCPLPTVQNPTINDNHIPGVVYLDIAASYNFNPQMSIYMKIDNTLNHNPPNYGSGSLYDWLGRIYRLGFRFNVM